MFRLIVTNDEEVVKFARERGAGIFAAEKSPEEVVPVTIPDAASDSSKAYELLRKLDVKPNINGYHYLKFIVEKCWNDPHYHQLSATKEIYPDCAKEFHTTGGRVERAIRHALGLSFENASAKYSQLFGGTFAKVPTNSEFIGLVCEYFANNK